MRGDYTVDDLIDALEGNRKYVDALFVYNKIDLISIEDIDELARRPDSLVVSVNLWLNLDFLLKKIWDWLNLIWIYTKKRGCEPDFEDPLILTESRQGCNISAICKMIHKDFSKDLKYALVWGWSAKFSPQTCGLSYFIRSLTMWWRCYLALC